MNADPLETADRAPFDHAWICLMLATTPEIWEALLLGEPVNEDALDQTWLARLRAAGVIE